MKTSNTLAISSDADKSRPAGHERYFYHSFPRRGKNSAIEVEKGLKILRSIRDFGLLLAPETVKWKQPCSNGTFREFLPVIQKRVCFTEIQVDEIRRHSTAFGGFGLEFDNITIRNIGAVPAFYLPRYTEEFNNLSAIGALLFSIAMDARTIFQSIDKFAEIIKTWNRGDQPTLFQFADESGKVLESTSLDIGEVKKFLDFIGYRVTPFSDMKNGMEAFLQFFQHIHRDKKKAPLDGRVTESILQKWAAPVEKGHARYDELHTALKDLCAQFGKKPNALARISIIQTEEDVHGAIDGDNLVLLLATVFQGLSPAQRSAFRRLVA